MANRRKVSEENRRPSKTALVLSAGAPHSPLMAGALYALYEKGKTFDVIYTSGAGGLIGLLYVAPKGNNPEEALKSFVEMGVSDPIYRLLPIGYKTFFKPGPFTLPIHRFAQRFKLGKFPLGKIDKPETSLGRTYNKWIEMWETPEYRTLKRLYNDLIDLWAAAITPTTLNFWSKGVCQPLPFIEHMVDFEELNDKHKTKHKNAWRGDFYMNAFCISDRPQALDTREERTTQKTTKEKDYKGKKTESGLKPHLFHNKGEGGITPQRVRASFAYPFIYPPVTIADELYFEGADRDPISFGNLLDVCSKYAEAENIKTVVLIDILGSLDQYLLREPRNLWDAFGMSIIAPVVAHAKKEVSRFKNRRNEVKREKERGLDKEWWPEEERGANEWLAQLDFFKEMSFDIPESIAPHMTDWSYSNMSSMFEIGYKAGKSFWNDHEAELNLPPDPRSHEPAPEPRGQSERGQPHVPRRWSRPSAAGGV